MTRYLLDTNIIPLGFEVGAAFDHAPLHQTQPPQSMSLVAAAFVVRYRSANPQKGIHSLSPLFLTACGVSPLASVLIR